jgi:hypothetical protein
MSFRILAGLAVTAGLLIATPAGAFSTDPKVKGTVTIAFKVEYRRTGTTAWMTKGSYASNAAARAEAQRLFDAGHDVRLTKAETITWLKSGKDERITPVTGDVHEGISVVNYQKALQVFKAVAARADIAFRYPTDGCYARAHLMGVQMQVMGLKPGKAWAFDDEAGKPGSKTPARLIALTDAHPKGFVSWWYHVAPALKVRKSDGTVVTAVIDPSLHDKPVSLATWKKRMMHPKVGFTPRMDVTVWGLAPYDASGKRMPGKGYSPGGEPADPTKAAKDTMAMYKPHQGTDWTPPRRVVAARGDKEVRQAVPAVPFTDKRLLDTGDIE